MDLRDRLKDIQQPALVMHCSEDKIVPVAQAHALAKALPNAELLIIEDTGHAPMLNHPHEVAAAMNRFIASMPGLAAG